MTERVDDGGPAFPSDLVIGNAVTAKKPYDGMSLRDYFAGQALVGLCGYEQQTWADIAVRAYRAADAMLEARK